MKEYSVTMTFKLESDKSDYEKIEIFAEELKEIVVDKVNHVDIEIVDSMIDTIDDYNNYNDIYMGEDFD